MPYLIDGHNLIPKITGLSLQNPDDELALIERLQRFAGIVRQPVDVYFDQAAPGHAGKRRYGNITAHFIQRSSSADAAIQGRLKRLGGDARNWKVVSSDRQVQAEAHSRGAQVIRSEEFAGQMETAFENAIAAANLRPEQALSEQEVDEWLAFFKQKRKGRP